MAVRYYDDVLAAKLKRWNPSSELRVLKPNETKRFFELSAEDSNDAPITLPCVTLARNNDIELSIKLFKKDDKYCEVKYIDNKVYIDRRNSLTPIESRFNVAFFGSLGYELDLSYLPLLYMT